MASYFDMEPRASASKTTTDASEEGAEANNKDYDEAYGRFGLLSPQVTRILEGLDLEDQSSGSDDNEDDENEQGNAANGLERDQSASKTRPTGTKGDDKSRGHVPPRMSDKLTASSTPSSSSKLRKALTPNEHDKPGKTSPKKTVEKSRSIPKGAKQPHFGRFQSLRTMLFSSHIEESLEKCKQEDAEERWKKDFQSRKGLERPKTPEQGTGPVTPAEERDGAKERGVVKRLGSRLKRLGSKDVQTMGTLTEGEAVKDKHVPQNKAVDVRHDTGNESTASSDEDEGDGRRESEEINHSDIEDLVRWVSRRDPPSDGEARHRKSNPRMPASNSDYADKSDSDQGSLGHSDVEDLVRWVSRREATNMRPDADIQPGAKGEEEGVMGTSYDPEGHASYIDADTESDSEADARKGRKATMNDADVDELVRWISRREGPNAGPVSSSNPNSPTKAVKTLDSGTGLSSSDSEDGDEDTEELIRWVKRTDDTSGESLDEASHPRPGKKNKESRLRDEVSQQTDDKADADGLEKTRTRDRAESGASLTPGDVDELVRWVSRKHGAA